ncbi:MAG: hypothetical protein K0M40_20260 [Prolixibacteraceae bacterium]|nr:hypothetical protein [Prolixibacteraceae bacterium]
MMELKAVVSNLLLIFAGLLFMLQANPLVAQKSSIKTDIDPQIGVDSKKGPPGIKTVDLVNNTNYPDIIKKKNEITQI